MRLLVILFVFLSAASCTDKLTNTISHPIEIPSHFTDPSYPHDNIPTIEKIELGKKLFFDTQLSKNKNISCASCHQPENAFADTKKGSLGTNNYPGFRNAPSLVNVAYKSEFHMDGGVRTLEIQALAPIIDTNEMSGDFNQILKYLQSDSIYVRLFNNAFDTVPTIYGLTRSIASYERSLIQGNSAYDLFLQGDSNALSNSQKNGLALFNSDRLNCNTCHSGVNLTNYSYQNIGLAHQHADSGRARITYNTDDAGKFIVPSLRNVILTAPYMHDGSIESIEEVIELLERGGGNHPNKSPLVVAFKLTETEKSDLISFFNSLTGSTFQ